MPLAPAHPTSADQQMAYWINQNFEHPLCPHYLSLPCLCLKHGTEPVLLLDVQGTLPFLSSI